MTPKGAPQIAQRIMSVKPWRAISGKGNKKLINQLTKQVL